METPAHPQLSRAPSRPSITYQAISALQPDARNPRTHSKRQIRQIADSIRAFGFTNPILVDEKGSVMAGHGRLEAAKLLGIRQVPTIRIGDLTEAQKRAYVIAGQQAGGERRVGQRAVNRGASVSDGPDAGFRRHAHRF